MIAIKGKQAIDCTGADPIADAVVLVDGERIVGVGPASRVAVPPGAEVIDVGEGTILPGLMDMHTHLGICPDLGDVADQMKAPDAEIAFRMVRNVRNTLRSGTTTVRTMFSKNANDMILKRSIEQGFVPGPRIFSGGTVIRPSHGHGQIYASQVDGVDAMRATVRKLIWQGVSHIKLFVTGGTGSKVTLPTQAYLTREEIQTAVEEAHNLDLPVAVHCHGGPSADWCIEAGVDTIEHGAWLTPSQMEGMVRKGTWLVPTIGIAFNEGEPGGVPKSPEIIAKRRMSQAVIRETFPRAIELGVKIASGTDAFHGRVWLELEFLVKFGMKPMAALLTATRNAAEVIRQNDALGTLEKGKQADVIAVRGDPLADISATKHVTMVMKGGQRFELSP